MIQVLLVEDDADIVKNLTEFLEKEDFSVVSASGQRAALAFLETRKVELVLLDIALADGNGFALCKTIRSCYTVPVIFLTASGDEMSTVTGFELGADDYIAKPFRPRELISRMKHALHLTGGNTRLTLGDLSVDTEKGMVTKNGKELYLSALEYRLLLFLLNHRSAVLSREHLLESIWDIAGGICKRQYAYGLY